MFNTCYQCGEYHANKIINPDGPQAICPNCGHSQYFIQSPLLLIGGASGAGKSTVCQSLLGKNDGFVLLEGDLLWREEFNKPEDKYREFFETWLRLCKSISQAGKPVVLFNAGMAVPENIEHCVERRYFSKVYYLALTCTEIELEIRLKNRPEWRHSSDRHYIQEQQQFNKWLIDNAHITKPQIDLLDTTTRTVDEIVVEVLGWINHKLENDV